MKQKEGQYFGQQCHWKGLKLFLVFSVLIDYQTRPSRHASDKFAPIRELWEKSVSYTHLAYLVEFDDHQNGK